MIARRPSRESGFTLAELFVGVIALVVVLAILVPAGRRAARLDGVQRCAGNLRTLHRALPAEPGPLGSALWTKLAVDPSVLRCPLAAAVEGRRCDYLGPARPTAPLGPDSAIGCDDEENHGEHGRRGGNVLRKSGSVLTDNGAVWREAIQLHCVR